MKQQLLEAENKELKEELEALKAKIKLTKEQRQERMYRSASLERDRANNWSGQ